MKKTALLCCLLCCIHTSMAQTSTDFNKFMNAITNMPALFQKLVDNVNNLAISQNKQKFYAFDTKMINHLNTVKSQKQVLVEQLKPGIVIKRDDVKDQITNLQIDVNDLKTTIDDYKDLLDGLHIEGFNTTELRADLNNNFVQKSQLLNDIIKHDIKKEANAAKISAELTKGISLLDSSISKLQKFDSELRKKNND